MREQISGSSRAELCRLLNLTRRVGNDPLLTQASTGNSSAKLNGILWIKASGKWMAHAAQDEFFIPLNLAEVTGECLRQHVDPAGRYRGASLETALHAVLPHRVVLHVHCVNTIAWAVRQDGRHELERLLDGLSWQWIPYVASGLPLAGEIERALSARPGADVFVLGNHGLVVCGEDTESVEALLAEVSRRVAVDARKPHPADYAVLWQLSQDSPWVLPDDDGIHALGTDRISETILAGGVLYPCQAIFWDPGIPELFRPVPYPDAADSWHRQCANRPFLMIQGRGVIVSKTIRPTELATLSGLAQVLQRLDAAAPIRYLTEAEVSAISGEVAYRYRELASASQAPAGR